MKMIIEMENLNQLRQEFLKFVALVSFVALPIFLLLGVNDTLSWCKSERSELKQELCQLEQFHHCEKI